MSENNLETIKYKELKDKINRGAKKKGRELTRRWVPEIIIITERKQNGPNV